MYFTNQQKFDNERITKIQGRLKTVRDSITAESEKNATDDYFSLQNNSNAREYFGQENADSIAIKVRDAIYAKNTVAGGNPLVGYPALEGVPFSIAKIKILNHRWIIVDFTNNKMWGEALLKYFIEDDGSVTLERIENTLYNPY